MPAKPLHPILENHYYHLYNRAHGNEIMFYNDDNYSFFLRKFKQFVSPVAHVACFCLMPNHYHFLILTKNIEEIQWDKLNMEPKELSPGEYNQLIIHQITKLQISYTIALNNQRKRKGGLFMNPFQRKAISGFQYLLELVIYIHNNPIKSGICKSPEKWKFSSYRYFILKKPSWFPLIKTTEWFSSIENFTEIHKI